MLLPEVSSSQAPVSSARNIRPPALVAGVDNSPEQPSLFSAKEAKDITLLIFVKGEEGQRLLSLGQITNVGELFDRCAKKLEIQRPFGLFYSPVGLDGEYLNVKVIDDDDFDMFVTFVQSEWKRLDETGVLIYIRIVK